jgi:NAD(P)-dependent dehydrogenase (short-subunit alcohol dehydrogenase family)
MDVSQPTGPFADQVAIITGGASGIGLATVRRFLADGAAVVLADLNGPGIVTAAEDLAAHCDRLATRVVDVSDDQQNQDLVQYAFDRFGRLDCFFANGAIPGPFKPLIEHTIEEYQLVVDVVLRSVFSALKHAGTALKQQGQGGSIICTSSVAAVAGGAGSPVYSAAKAGVSSLVQVAAAQLAPDRIRVNAICPGPTLTGISRATGGGDPDEVIGARLASLLPWPDYGHPEMQADVVAFLASPQSEFIIGQSILVDGGLTASGLRVRDRLAELERTYQTTGAAAC